MPRDGRNVLGGAEDHSRFRAQPGSPITVGSLRTIAVDLDDTLNNFTQTLWKNPFAYDERYVVPPATFDAYLDRFVRGTAGHTEYLERVGIDRLMALRVGGVS